MKFRDNPIAPNVTDPNESQHKAIDWWQWNAVKDKPDTWQTVTLIDEDTGQYVEVFGVDQTAPGLYTGHVQRTADDTQTTPGETFVNPPRQAI